MPNIVDYMGLSYFVFSCTYIVLRFIFFTSLFSLIYKIFSEKFKIVSEAPSREQIKSEIIGNIQANIYEVFMIYFLLKLHIVKLNAFSWTNFVITFFSCYLFFEMWFYFTHYLMHKTLFKKAHKQHHRSIITNPLSALNLSISEKTLNDIGMLVIPALFTHISNLFIFEGILLYHLFNYYVNVLGHSNLELLPKWFANTWLGSIFTTSTYHSIHHLKSTRNLGLFTTVCDRVFGTYDETYKDIFNKVKNNEQVTRKIVLQYEKA